MIASTGLIRPNRAVTITPTRTMTMKMATRMIVVRKTQPARSTPRRSTRWNGTERSASATANIVELLMIPTTKLRRLSSPPTSDWEGRKGLDVVVGTDANEPSQLSTDATAATAMNRRTSAPYRAKVSERSAPTVKAGGPPA